MSDLSNPAFPITAGNQVYNQGMTLRDWFAGQALANPAICTGNVTNGKLDEWFGRHKANISRAEIIVRQAWEYADAMLEARK